MQRNGLHQIHFTLSHCFETKMMTIPVGYFLGLHYLLLLLPQVGLLSGYYYYNIHILLIIGITEMTTTNSIMLPNQGDFR